MNIEQWTTVVLQAVARHSQPLTTQEEASLRVTFVDGDASQQTLIKRVGQPLMREILCRGRDAQTFGDPARLRDDILYGSVEEVYPGASRTFLNVTRSFLTFWREYLDVANLTPQTVLQRTLWAVVGNHKKVFFPAINIRTAAPYMLFADEQRRILTAFGGGIDTDDFFRCNPLLERTANPLRGSGCLVIASLLVGVFLTVCVLTCYLTL